MTVNYHMKRYICTLMNGHEFYVRADDDHEAAESAATMAQRLGAELADVMLDPNQEAHV
tara:strand:+ start:176 stop:352 length:177 start_codon:yes stop_codon:yes gene_type:complete